MPLRFGRLFMAGLGVSALAALASQAPARSPDETARNALSARQLSGRPLRQGAAGHGQCRRVLYARPERDPKNDVLLEQAFQMEVMNGNWERALPLAEQLAAAQPTHRMSRFLLGVSAFKRGQLTPRRMNSSRPPPKTPSAN